MAKKIYYLGLWLIVVVSSSWCLWQQYQLFIGRDFLSVLPIINSFIGESKLPSVLGEFMHWVTLYGIGVLSYAFISLLVFFIVDEISKRFLGEPLVKFSK